MRRWPADRILRRADLASKRLAESWSTTGQPLCAHTHFVGTVRPSGALRDRVVRRGWQSPMQRGRPEQAVDVGCGPVAAFATLLRDLRLSAGRPSYRELSTRANYSSSALSEATRGRRLPSLEVTLAFVRSCGGDEEEWTNRWHECAEQLAMLEQRSPDLVARDGWRGVRVAPPVTGRRVDGDRSVALWSVAALTALNLALSTMVLRRTPRRRRC